MDQTSSESRISSEQLEALPANDIWDVLAIQGGVTKDATGGIHIRGGRKSEVAFWVDGVSVTDVYDGAMAMNVENNTIQELQVISGTFNAEYGQAMSGIVNLVTKDGGDQYSGSFTTWFGDYYTNDGIYRGLDKLDFADEQNYQVSLSGPIPLTGNRLTFYSSYRSNSNTGYLRGLDAFGRYYDVNTGDDLHAKFITPDEDLQQLLELIGLKWVAETPDGYEVIDLYGEKLAAEIVPLNWRNNVTLNSKLTFHASDRLNLRLSYLSHDESYQDYEHEQKLVPEGEKNKFNKGRDLSFSLTHSLTSRTFYSLRLSSFYKAFEMWLFESPTDAGYVDRNYLNHLVTFAPPEYSFDYDKIDLQRYERQSATKIAKFDLTSQLNERHQLQFGAEVKEHNLTLDDYDLSDSLATDFEFTIKIPEKALDSFNRDYYDVKPRELGVYLQDKIEHKNVIINIGLRWDWFDANGQVPTNRADPYLGNPQSAELDSLSLAERLDVDWTRYADVYQDSSLIGKTGWWTDTKPHHQFSPRIGVAYPISERGVIHFSFGHFFQIPPFQRLYDNPGYKIPEEAGRHGIFGNAALKPQQTVMYELGLNQAFGDLWSVDLTTFYRDVRNWVSTGIPIDMGGGCSYFTYVNKDYSNVRGVTVDVERRFRNYFALSLNYSFQVAEGSNSDPDDEFGALENDEEPPRSIIPLEWDQRHTLNGTLFFGTDRWGATLLGTFGSGYPYTPENVFSEERGQSLSVALLNNSRRKPMTYSFDLKLFYKLPLSAVKAETFLYVYNLFDRRNEQTVYGNTGRANRNLIAPTDDNPAYASIFRPNKISDFFNRPDWYSPPRQIQVGFNVSF
ncbi:TonB-dependent receptor plug domain-containing protein [Candidatus Neomarinimicrobiota bacterium]